MKHIFDNYYITDEGKVLNQDTGKHLKITDGKVKLKKNGKTVTINVDDYITTDYTNFENSDEKNKHNNIIWILKCVETKQRFESIEQAAQEMKINPHAILMNLKKRKTNVCGCYHFEYNPNIKKF